jgi:hypothetical protein
MLPAPNLYDSDTATRDGVDRCGQSCTRSGFARWPPRTRVIASSGGTLWDRWRLGRLSPPGGCCEQSLCQYAVAQEAKDATSLPACMHHSLFWEDHVIMKVTAFGSTTARALGVLGPEVAGVTGGQSSRTTTRSSKRRKMQPSSRILEGLSALRIPRVSHTSIHNIRSR